MGDDPKQRPFSNAEFDAVLRRAAAELREARGPCPEGDDLVAYFEGRLEPSRRAVVADHVASCGLCDAALGRLERTTGWSSLPLRALWNPMVAYGLVLVLLYPAWVGVRAVTRPQPRQPSAAPAHSEPTEARFVRVIEFDAVRGTAPTIELPPDVGWVVVRFFAPVPTRGTGGFVVDVIGARGAPVVEGTSVAGCDPAGMCGLLVARGVLPPGEYWLRLKQPDGQVRMQAPFRLASR